MSASAHASRSVVVVIRAERGLGVVAGSACPWRRTGRTSARCRPAAGQRLVGDVAQDDPQPACAETWAMPEPMSPAPMTATWIALIAVSAMAGRLRQDHTDPCGRTASGRSCGARASACSSWAFLALLLRWAFARGSSLVERPARPGHEDEYGALVPVASPGSVVEAELLRLRLRRRRHPGHAGPHRSTARGSWSSPRRPGPPAPCCAASPAVRAPAGTCSRRPTPGLNGRADRLGSDPAGRTRG